MPSGIQTAVVLLLVITYSVDCRAQHYPWTDRKSGPFKVGLEFVALSDSSNIAIWYPASSIKGKPISIRDLILKGRPPGDTTRIEQLKKITERIYGTTIGNVYYRALNLGTHSYRTGKKITGKKFPVIIARADAYSYFDLFESLASNGYIVAGISKTFIKDPPTPDGPFHYKRETDLLESLLKFISTYPAADTTHINAFGHGGGIQSAMYLAMRTGRVKKVINLDGGFFGPRSKSMNSSDYHPEKFTAELLNIVTPSLDKDEDKQQINALSSHMVRALIKPVTVRHHDFTIFGHIHAMIDHADDPDVKNVLQAIDLSIFKFLTNQLKNEENEVLKIDAF